MLLTSHYMDDVVALCPRVVVIDHGHLIYDGDLRALARKIRPDKHVTIRLSKPVDHADLARLGTVVSANGVQAVLSVPSAQASTVVRDALATLPIIDLTIEEAPLEEGCGAVRRQGRPRAVADVDAVAVEAHAGPEARPGLRTEAPVLRRPGAVELARAAKAAAGSGPGGGRLPGRVPGSIPTTPMPLVMPRSGTRRRRRPVGGLD